MVKLPKDDYLQQNDYSPYDHYCPFYKMVNDSSSTAPAPAPAICSLPPCSCPADPLLCRWGCCGTSAPSKTCPGTAWSRRPSQDNKITWNVIREAMSQIMYQLASMKFKVKKSY